MNDENDIRAIRAYWNHPTSAAAARVAAPGLVELAQRHINILCDEVEVLTAERDALKAENATLRATIELTYLQFKGWMNAGYNPSRQVMTQTIRETIQRLDAVLHLENAKGNDNA